MLRYFYLLCLSFAIKHCFCYSYIIDGDDVNETTNHRPVRKNRIYNQKNGIDGKPNAIKSRPEYEVVNAKDPMAQIDVASFIRNPDEYAVEDNSLYETETKKRTSINKFKPILKKKIDDDLTISEKLLYPNAAIDDKMTRNIKPHSYKDSLNPLYKKSKITPGYRWEFNKKSVRNSDDKPSINNRNYVNELAEKRDTSTHNAEKKGSLRNFKIPFFSHSKNSEKLKKNNKRKLFCFHCANKNNKEMETSSETHDILKENETKDSEHLNKMTDDNIQNPVNASRRKREDWMEDKERQLNEIEEIQRKIDRVGVTQNLPKN